MVQMTYEAEIVATLTELMREPFVQAHLSESDIAQSDGFDDLIFKVIRIALRNPFGTEELNFLQGVNLENYLTINMDLNSDSADLNNWLQQRPEILVIAFLLEREFVRHPTLKEVVLINSDLIFSAIQAAMVNRHNKCAQKFLASPLLQHFISQQVKSGSLDLWMQMCPRHLTDIFFKELGQFKKSGLVEKVYKKLSHDDIKKLFSLIPMDELRKLASSARENSANTYAVEFLNHPLVQDRLQAKLLGSLFTEKGERRSDKVEPASSFELSRRSS